METYNTEEIDNVPDYFLARANNGGMGCVLLPVPVTQS